MNTKRSSRIVPVVLLIVVILLTLTGCGTYTADNASNSTMTVSGNKSSATFKVDGKTYKVSIDYNPMYATFEIDGDTYTFMEQNNDKIDVWFGYSSGGNDPRGIAGTYTK